MSKAYVRFVIDHIHPESNLHDGLFDAANDLSSQHPETDQSDRKELEDLLDWFDKHLPEPDKFNRTTSKGNYRRATRGISWFRCSASEHIAHMQQMTAILEKYGYRVAIICENRVGYIVYEDEFQVVAEPFVETRPSPHSR